ncbi:LysR substrate-binding domain-containing protein [Amycolatopsis rhabdoformis]|uniref:LysR substrate-binding domain-containing protein n=1 Tax=Amycolatopsis rhabdoformis TaxID=1448059 RepID=A0ABZ1IL59_9PSEU|nr:LysR substrate-binding domain-containing protein [Amycolatopsis rhabdoformis]WSE34601.1 LysR substrate-binding domain-containing protein [Amycolatopsis rhabdoformis]
MSSTVFRVPGYLVNMSDPELRLLRYFVTVAEERHFGRAAERLHIAQPPLSQQIRKLEYQLGVELIDRSRRPIELTDAGEALFAEARLALVHSERAFAAARRAATGHLGHVRIGALQAAVNGMLSFVMREHRREYPDVKLDVAELDTREQTTQLVEHKLDIGFLRGPIDEPALTVETLIEDSLAAVVPDEHPLGNRDLIDPASLVHEPLILWTRAAGATMFADVVELFRSHNLQLPVAEESARVQTILALVAAGTGIALLPTSFVNLGRHGVRFIPLQEPLPYRPLSLAWRTGNQSPSLTGFITVTRKTTADYRRDLIRRHPQLRTARTGTTETAHS